MKYTLIIDNVCENMKALIHMEICLHNIFNETCNCIRYIDYFLGTMKCLLGLLYFNQSLINPPYLHEDIIIFIFNANFSSRCNKMHFEIFSCSIIRKSISSLLNILVFKRHGVKTRYKVSRHVGLRL